MANELVDVEGHIDINDNGNYTKYSANKIAKDRARALSDEDFEREIKNMPQDMQTFMRFMRG